MSERLCCTAVFHHLHILPLRRSPSSLSNNIDEAMIRRHSANIICSGDFNVHNKEWLSIPMRRMLPVYFVIILLSQYLNQKVSFPTRIPDRPYQDPYLLDVFSISGTSDHLVISVSIDFMVKSTNEHSYHRNVYNFNNADWDSFRDYLRDVP